MDKTQGLKVTRRSILKTIPALSAISAGSSFFTKAACAQEPVSYTHLTLPTNSLV